MYFINVVIDAGEKFYFFAAVFIVNGIINDKDFSFVAGSQRGAETGSAFRNLRKKSSPAMILRRHGFIPKISNDGPHDFRDDSLEF